MNIRCPYCRELFERGSEAALRDVRCPHCERPFHLVSDVSPDDTTQLRVIGHFRLLDKVGAGGFGEVWKARDEQLDRFVAIKIPRPEWTSPADADRIVKEARSAARVKHPNIVDVYEVGRDNSLVYIVSELIDGCNMEEWLPDSGNRHLEIASAMAKVADAVNAAHRSAVIHRDLKPGNILVDARGEPHVTDFGLALHAASNVTLTYDGRIVGTPAYMSPEQAESGTRANALSDIYSLGASLYRLLVGRPPFQGSLAAVLTQLETAEPVPPRTLDPDIPVDLESICLKAMSKDASRRYATAADLATDLRAFTQGQPVAARPVGRLERTWRWARRNRRLAALLSTVALLIGLLTLGSVTAAVVYRAQRIAADEARRETLVQSTHLAAQRGAWQQTLDSFDQLEPLAGDVDLALRMDRLRALSALGRRQELGDEVLRLRDDPNLGQWTAQLRMWEGELNVGVDPHLAAERIREADRLGLPLAASEYAQGLLASTVPEARDRFSNVVASDPLHHRANYLLCTSLMLLGEFSEAEERLKVLETSFADDPGTPFLRTLLRAFRGDIAAVDPYLASLPAATPAAQRQELSDVLLSIASMAAAEGLPEHVPSSLADRSGGGFTEFASLPPVIAAGFEAIIRSGVAIANKTAIKDFGFQPPPDFAARMRELADVLPVGIAKLGLAMCEADLRQHDLIAEAQAMMSPISTPGFTNYIQFWVMDDLFQRWKAAKEGQTGDLRRVTKTQLVRCVMLPNLSEMVGSTAFGVATMANEPELARTLVRRLEDGRLTGQQGMVSDNELVYYRSKADWLGRAYGPAIDAAASALAADPSHARAKQVLDDSRRALAEEYQKYLANVDSGETAELVEPDHAQAVGPPTNSAVPPAMPIVPEQE